MFRVVEFRAVFALYHLDRGHLVSIAFDLGLSCGGTHFCASRTGCGAWFREITSSTLKLLVRLWFANLLVPKWICPFSRENFSANLAQMFAKIYSAAVFGVDAYEVEIEVNSAGGLPAIVVVGLPDPPVKESNDRVTTAISSSGYYWPRGRTTVNLAPADIKKEGPSFDLPIALGMIACSLETDTAEFSHYSFVGELALDGAVRAVKGVLPVAIEARK